jgi:hypothetical protein
MRRPIQEIAIVGVQDRRARTQAKLPWIVRHAVDGRQRSKAFRTRAEADRYRTLLLQAVTAGQRFDEATGEPESWHAPMADLHVHEWTRQWLAQHWDEWQPRTRASAAEALARFVTYAVRTPPSTADLRRYLQHAWAPGGAGGDRDLESWLKRNCLVLAELDRDVVADIDRRLGLRLDGSPLAANTANRIRIVCRACVGAAADAGATPDDPWPPRSRNRTHRKVARKRRTVDVRKFPDPATMAAAIDAIVTHQPGSRVYHVMTAVAYYAGLRPSEVVMLRVRSLALPEGAGDGSTSPRPTSPSTSRVNQRPGPARSRFHPHSSASSATGLTNPPSHRVTNSSSAPATTRDQAHPTGAEPGTVPSPRWAKNPSSRASSTRARPLSSPPVSPA